jgi:RNA polymerase sigma-70 factor (ECF subfamily)
MFRARIWVSTAARETSTAYNTATGVWTRAMVAPEITDAVVREVEPVLLAFAVRAVRQRAIAQDLVQETFVAALEAKAGFEGRSSLRTWLVGILVRKILMHFRKHKREVVTDTMTELERPADFAPSREVSPERRLDQQSAMAVIQRTLPLLSELERVAVLLCDIEQMERDEACNVLGVQPTNLRVLLHRGRHKLRKALEDAALQPS